MSAFGIRHQSPAHPRPQRPQYNPSVRCVALLGMLVFLALPAFAQSPAPSVGAPAEAEALVLDGIRLLKAEQLDEAYARFTEAVTREPSLATAHYFLGFVLERRRDLDGAAKEYELALVSDPKMAEAHDRLGFVRGLQGRYRARRWPDSSTPSSLNPRLFDAQYHLGVTRWMVQDFSGALEPLKAAVALQPTNPDAHYYLGVVLRRLGQLDAAIGEFRTATKLSPTLASPTPILASRCASVAMSTMRS